jgi:hypothetical protein
MSSKTTPKKPRRLRTMRPPLDTQLPAYNDRDSLQDLQDQHDLGLTPDEEPAPPAPPAPPVRQEP